MYKYIKILNHKKKKYYKILGGILLNNKWNINTDILIFKLKHPTKKKYNEKIIKWICDFWKKKSIEII